MVDYPVSGLLTSALASAAPVGHHGRARPGSRADRPAL